ncbi:3'(2'),5'-bisphosphate nucleotidase CysQ [Devosia sp. WQ 349]|uniref:3'(2'),5'-bisphosphate nucleotidase CysQ n=1 Tax=Devosia sp. WQ 349K1 TaxID=2800329 RepID=UPI00190860F3|nr:3'(2'),5'-bisphosphate nucleotidase CysQ [Devosia sp. WQ 349K1]MBK1794241.1 3'(2'),5'-bisphosphate nucleotidase CysQ [Devosia sp. WQ 349K1]
MLPLSTNPITALAIRASIDAAKVICEVYHRPIAVVSKSDGSPVTEADGAAEAVILEHLNTTGIPVLAEESAAAGYIPELGEKFFVVDPLDGTKEFIKRNGEFTVNIALVEGVKPVMGVVLAPVSGELFVGDRNGAWSAVVVDGEVTNIVPLQVQSSDIMRVVASRSHGHVALEKLCAHFAIEEDVSVGSSLKFCLLARGDAQLYPRFTPTNEWDTAAGQAVLEAAGGVVLTLDGLPLAYKKAESNYLNPFFVAANSEELAQRAALKMVTTLNELEPS